MVSETSAGLSGGPVQGRAGRPTPGAVIATATILGLVASGILVLGSLQPERDTVTATRVVLPGVERKLAGHAAQASQSELAQRFGQGVAMMQMGQFEHALTAFHRVLVLEPKLPEAHVNIGFALYELRRYAEAQRFFEGAIALAPKQANGHYGFALARLAQGDPLAAEPAMRRYLELAPDTDGFRPVAESRLKDIVALASKQRREMGHPPRRQYAQ
jgi:tetratricopeptide (TPR) repeat protein